MTSRYALVLGGHGFVGRHTCRELAHQGYEVTSLGHGDWLQEEQRAWGVTQWKHANINTVTIAEAVAGRPLDVAIHCAGSGAVSNSYQRPLEDFERSVSTTAALLESVREHPPPKPRIVLASSAAVYGDQGDVDLTETSTGAPVSPYGVHKLLAEGLCNSYHRFFGVRISIVRLFSIYGEGLKKQLLWDAAHKLLGEAPRFFGTGHELRDWLHVEDAARLLCAAGSVAEQSTFEIYNGGGTHASTGEVVSCLATALGAKSPPAFSGETHHGNPRRLTADSGHAQRQLTWASSVDLARGLSRYAEWFLAIPNRQ